MIKEGQNVWIKIIGVLDNRVRVSMKDINQFNGKDLAVKEKVKNNHGED